MNLPFDPSDLDAIERRLSALLEKRQEKQRLENSLIDFYRAAWPHMDPAPYTHGRHLEAIAEHLEAVARGEIRKLLINIAPRHSKSLLVSVAWPAWIWAQEPNPMLPLMGPGATFMCLSYGDELALDLALKSRRLITGDWYRSRWGSRVQLTSDQEAKSKFDTTAGGTRISGSFRGVVTGRGASIKVIDDPLKANDEKSDVVREGVNDTYDGVLKSRFTDPKTNAEVIVMQRLHESDLSGHLLEQDNDFVHLFLPAEFEEGRRCCTPIISGRSGRYPGKPWEDWREEGELLWPERFGEIEIAPFKRDAYVWSAQWQQRPEPPGGGIILRDYWRPWYPKDGKWPKCDYILASLDPAYTAKDKNDPSALTVWGAFDHEGERGVILLQAWRKWLPIHGPEEPRYSGETNEDYRARTMPNWGLVEHVKEALERFKVDRLLIENKASGHDVNIEMLRLYKDLCTYELVDPRGLDKIARVWRVQPIFSEGQVWAPWTMNPSDPGDPGDWRKFAALVIDEMAQVTPLQTGKYDDLCFVAGTKIATKRGNIPIEAISLLDVVLTPFGWKKVSACGFTGVRPVISKFGLTGTPEHPVFTVDHGFESLDSVNCQSTLSRINLCDLIKIIRLSLLSSMECSTAEWAARDAIISLNPKAMKNERRQKVFTSRFGNSTLGKAFQKVTRSIILTTIPLIASLGIWSAYQKASIVGSLKTGIKTAISKISSAFDPWLRSGTSPRRGVSGIAKTHTRQFAGQDTSALPFAVSAYSSASGAAKNLNEEMSETRFALMPAKTTSQELSAGKVQDTRNMPIVLGVDLNLNESTHLKLTAPQNAFGPCTDLPKMDLEGCIPTMRPVFNLTVEGAHCYYANGILVHNCDSSSAALHWLREHGFLTRRSEKAAERLREAKDYRSVAQAKTPLYPV